jgi:hypothetical protein
VWLASLQSIHLSYPTSTSLFTSIIFHIPWGWPAVAFGAFLFFSFLFRFHSLLPQTYLLIRSMSYDLTGLNTLVSDLLRSASVRFIQSSKCVPSEADSVSSLSTTLTGYPHK